MEQDPRHQKLQELFSDRKALKELLEHPGWKLLSSVVEQQIRLRRIELFVKELSGLDACFALAKSQGEVAGLQMLQHLVSSLIADADANISAIQTEMEEENEGKGEK